MTRPDFAGPELDRAQRWRRGLGAALGCGAVALISSLWWRPAQSMMPDSVRIPIVKQHPEGAPADAALFRHGRHDNYSCAVCHPAVFPTWRAGFTHADMSAGRYCGMCHDGEAASATESMSCEGCHVPN